MVEVPISALTIGNSLIFGDPVPKTKEERINLIKHIPKICLINVLASLNYRLRPYDSLEYNYDFNQQKEELLYFCGGTKMLWFSYLNKVLTIASELEQKRDQVIIFNRSANLFALQEIISSDLNISPDGFNLWSVWDDILRYYLAVNDVISEFLPADEANFNEFERLSAGHLFMNSLQVVNTPFLSFERFINIVDYFKSSSDFSRYFADFFMPAGFDPEEYLQTIVALFVSFRSENKDRAHVFEIPNEFKKYNDVLKLLSDRTEYQKRHDYDLTDLKKYPFYKVSDNKFILLDLGFFIDKSYHLFIYDFFFDYLQPNGVSYTSYAGKVGLFFEEYVSQILTKSFSDTQIVVKSLDQLKTYALGSEVELADFYLRESNQVVVGQVKVSGLNTKQTEGMVESLFSGGKDFYKDFGLLQIIKSLEYLRDIPKEYENEILNTPLEVFPVIVLNDALCSTPFMPMLFQKKLEELLQEQQFINLIIRPITLIHIQDLELLGYNILNQKVTIWQALSANYENALFPRPFKATLSRLGIHGGSYNYSATKLAEFMGLE